MTFADEISIHFDLFFIIQLHVSHLLCENDSHFSALPLKNNPFKMIPAW